MDRSETRAPLGVDARPRGQSVVSDRAPIQTIGEGQLAASFRKHGKRAAIAGERPQTEDGVRAQSWIPSNPTVQVSWGELIDKITILEIKEMRLESSKAVANVRRELTALRAIQDVHTKNLQLAHLTKELKAINDALWEIENAIRAKEAAKEFDQGFVDLARSVYFQNDRRGNVKRQIDILMGSEIVEEKQYVTSLLSG
jgi:hypothetical protein